jgi:hypothetical protein
MGTARALEEGGTVLSVTTAYSHNGHVHNLSMVIGSNML